MIRRNSFLLLLLLVVPAVGTTAQPVPISQVQGEGAQSPLLGEIVTVEGVIVALFLPHENGESLEGFFIVEEESDRDADPETSEGLFIWYPEADTALRAGDLVRVVGRVVEYETGGGRSSLTELSGVRELVRIGTAPIPPPVILSEAEDLARLESVEGMNVRFATAMVVVENQNLDRYGEIRLALPPEYSEIDAERPLWPTSYIEPGPTAFARLADERKRTILLDDGETTSWPDRAPDRSPWTPADAVRTGSERLPFTAIVDERYGEYRLQPIPGEEVILRANEVGAAPRFEGEDVPGTIRVASFNVGNFFLTLSTGNLGCGPEQNLDCRGAETAEERSRQEEKLAAALAGLDADIVALVEIENSTGVTPAVRLAEITGAKGEYAAVETGVVGTDVIRNGFLYRPEVVEPIGPPVVLDQSVDRRFNDRSNRPSIAQRFRSRQSGGTMTVVVNHFKSKGSPCDDRNDPDRNDGQGNCNATRRLAAEALRDWIAEDPTGSDDPDYLVVGDFNAYTLEDPVVALEQEGRLLRLPLEHPDDGGRTASTYTFDGLAGALDHAFATPSLQSQILAAGVWHINADTPDLLDYRQREKSAGQRALIGSGPERSSDHDPIIVAVDLRSDSATTDVRRPRPSPHELDLTIPAAQPERSISPPFRRESVPGRDRCRIRSSVDTFRSTEVARSEPSVGSESLTLKIVDDNVISTNSRRSEMGEISREEQIAKLRDFIDDIDVGMLTTVEPDGTLRSRPMSTARDDADGTLWFFTDEGSPKVDEIEKNRQVCVSYADPDDSAYVSISGTASIVTDREKIEELWHPTLRTWFPEGLDDPRVCLLRVEPEMGEYWDTDASRIVQVVGLARALVTGTGATGLGENEKVTL